MTRRLMGLRPRDWNWRKIGMGMAVLSGLGLAFACGRFYSPPLAMALPPFLGGTKDKPPEPRPDPAAPAGSMGDTARRPVAYIYGTIMISRADLGEYLIARDGESKLPFLVNHRIIEHACKRHGVEVVQAEVEAAFNADLNDLKVDANGFEERLLKQYKKTSFEWKQDVIWPKLALTKLARDRIRVEPKDLHDAFEAYNGEKVDGRLIIYKHDEKSFVLNKIYPELRSSEEEFNRYAKMQASPTLASRGGRLEHPVGRHTTGDDLFEKEIFGLRPGEVSTVMERPEGLVIFKCDRHIDADTTVQLADVRAKLEKEIIDKKTQLELPKVFEELKKEANPILFLRRGVTEEDLDRNYQVLMGVGASDSPRQGAGPGFSPPPAQGP